MFITTITFVIHAINNAFAICLRADLQKYDKVDNPPEELWDYR